MAAPEPRVDGRCDQCGYSLVGLAAEGVCPECGSDYDEQSAGRLTPWPSAAMICLRLGWPLAALGIVVAISDGGRMGGALTMVIACALAMAVPVNSWWQVRDMLKRSLPEHKRTRGAVFMLRSIGTTLCVLVFCGLLFPFIFLVGCLLQELSGRGGNWAG